MPLTTAGGDGAIMLREVHTGASAGFPSRSSTLNAAMLPALASPFVAGNLNAECVGPHTGASTHRVSCASSQLAKLPHVPAPAKSMSSLDTRSDRNSGVRWSDPPSASESSRNSRPSFPEPTSNSRPLYSKTTGVTFMSRSRFQSHSALDGVYQPFSLSSFGESATTEFAYRLVSGSYWPSPVSAYTVPSAPIAG